MKTLRRVGVKKIVTPGPHVARLSWNKLFSGMMITVKHHGLFGVRVGFVLFSAGAVCGGGREEGGGDFS